MKIKLLITRSDTEYVEHLSNVLSEKYADTFEVSICSSAERFYEMIATNKIDVVLLESGFEHALDVNAIRLPIMLCDQSTITNDDHGNMKKIYKYQRISTIVGIILENYAEFGTSSANFRSGKGTITAVWSPYGGVGKTTVALAYAAHKVSKGGQVIYLNLENFSSVPVYFPENGKSISTVFEKLESNVQMLLMGIRQQDSGSGITYFGSPNNYDDINILTVEDIQVLVNACAAGGEEVIIDLSSHCDQRVQKIFELADTILLVCDSSSTSQVKLKQFMNQHNVSQRIQPKTVLVNNKNAEVAEPSIDKMIRLPFVQSNNPISVYKTLSGLRFEW